MVGLCFLVLPNSQEKSVHVPPSQSVYLLPNACKSNVHFYCAKCYNAVEPQYNEARFNEISHVTNVFRISNISSIEVVTKFLPTRTTL